MAIAQRSTFPVRIPVLASLLCLAPAVHADWLIGQRGTLLSSQTVDMAVFQLPPPGCQCVMVAEAKLLGKNGNQFTVQVGRWPSNSDANPHIRVQWRYPELDEEGNIRYRTLTQSLGANWSSSTVTLIFDRSVPSVTITWRRPGVNVWVHKTISPGTLPWKTDQPQDRSWSGTKQLQAQGRFTHDLPVTLSLRVDPLPGTWYRFASASNPFTETAGSALGRFGVTHK